MAVTAEEESRSVRVGGIWTESENVCGMQNTVVGENLSTKELGFMEMEPIVCNPFPSHGEGVGQFGILDMFDKPTFNNNTACHTYLQNSCPFPS